MEFRGWIEEGGRVLCESSVQEITPERLCRCGGEFFLKTDRFTARDRYGIMPGACPAGVILSGGREISLCPDVPDLSLADAIAASVRLRSEDSVCPAVVTLSGGVDSALIAALAHLPCITIGFAGSHDISAAIDAADRLDLRLTVYEITEEDLDAVLPDLLPVLPRRTPMDIEIGLTGYFVGRAARDAGAEKVLTGQSADELFGGYARYGRSTNLRAELDADFCGLAAQRDRDSAAVGVSGVWYSLPYMDERVIRASRRFSDRELVDGDLRKIALRKVAEQYLPKDIAWRPKKAMQYGSGMTAALRRLAKRNGCSDIGRYGDQILCREPKD